jgi:hypothetical protein
MKPISKIFKYSVTGGITGATIVGLSFKASASGKVGSWDINTAIEFSLVKTLSDFLKEERFTITGVKKGSLLVVGVIEKSLDEFKKRIKTEEFLAKIAKIFQEEILVEIVTIPEELIGKNDITIESSPLMGGAQEFREASLLLSLFTEGLKTKDWRLYLQDSSILKSVGILFGLLLLAFTQMHFMLPFLKYGPIPETIVVLFLGSLLGPFFTPMVLIFGFFFGVGGISFFTQLRAIWLLYFVPLSFCSGFLAYNYVLDRKKIWMVFLSTAIQVIPIGF